MHCLQMLLDRRVDGAQNLGTRLINLCVQKSDGNPIQSNPKEKNREEKKRTELKYINQAYSAARRAYNLHLAAALALVVGHPRVGNFPVLGLVL